MISFVKSYFNFKTLVSTSANISGEKIATKFSEISNQIKENVDYVVNLRHNDKMTKASNIILINKDKTIKKIVNYSDT